MIRKKVKTIALLVFLFLCLSSIAAQEKPILTVLDLDASGISEGEMRGIISLLTSGLFKTDQFTVIDVSERDAVMKEIEFSLSGCSDEACQIELGKMLSAEFIVVGTIDKVGSRLVISIKMIETSTSRTASTADGIYDNVDDLIDDLFNLASVLAGLDPTESTPEVVETAPVEEAPAAPPVEPLQPEESRASLSIGRILNFSGLTVGVIAAGAGGYLLYEALNFYYGDVADALTTYENLPFGTSQTVLDSAYNDYLNNYDQFQTDLIIAASVAGGGLVLSGVFSFLLLSNNEEPAGEAVAFYNPYARAVTLSYRIPMK